MAREARCEFWKGRDGLWYFHKHNANHTITEPSQGYASSQGCRRAAKRDVPGVPLVRLDAPPA